MIPISVDTAGGADYTSLRTAVLSLSSLTDDYEITCARSSGGGDDSIGSNRIDATAITYNGYSIDVYAACWRPVNPLQHRERARWAPRLTPTRTPFWTTSSAPRLSRPRLRSTRRCSPQSPRTRLPGPRSPSRPTLASLPRFARRARSPIPPPSRTRRLQRRTPWSAGRCTPPLRVARRSTGAPPPRWRSVCVGDQPTFGVGGIVVTED